MAEHMPVSFKEKFDVITSHWQIEYSVLPHLMLRNIAHALAPNGQAEIDIHAGNLYDLLSLQPELGIKTTTYFKKNTADQKQQTKQMPLNPLMEREISEVQNLRIARIAGEIKNLNQTGNFKAHLDKTTIRINRIN